MKTLLTALNTASDAVLDKLREDYPKGLSVTFFIQSRQVVPSSGTIIGHTVEVNHYSYRSVSFPALLVRHDQAKPNSRYSIRRVPLESVLHISGEPHETDD